MKSKLTLRNVFCITALAALFGCSAPLSSYQAVKPRLNPQTFFNGNLYASGVVRDFKGKIIRTFSAELMGSWENGVGTLDEQFTFNDGERQRRVWTMTPIPGADINDNLCVASLNGTAGDVVGSAAIRVCGNAMFLKYKLKIPYKDSTLTVTVDDKMYLSSSDTIINESKLYKFGIKVGSILLTIYKR